MKTALIILSLLISFNSYTQENKVFSLSPMSSSTDVVNGLVVGIGHFETRSGQSINGVNLDLMALSPMIFLLGGGHGLFDKPKVSNDPVNLVTNGLNIAAGGYLGKTIHNGLSISLYNKTVAMNGMSITATVNTAESLKGLQIALMNNNSINSSGVNISISNNNDYMSGLQLGLVNRSQVVKGLQIGLFNRSKSVHGVQIGLININSKRALPIINW